MIQRESSNNISTLPSLPAIYFLQGATNPVVPLVIMRDNEACETLNAKLKQPL